MDNQVYLKAKKYSSLKYAIALIDLGLMLLLLFLFQASGLSKWLVINLFNAIEPVFILPAYLLIAHIGYYLLDFPLNFYRSFVLEHKFALSKQKISDWLLDQVKGGIISYVISIILLEAFYYILRHNPYHWWLIVSIFWIFFSIILANLLPVVIIPLFFKYKKLSDENLRGRIIELAKKIKVKILDVFEIDFSKKTLKANAAFVGWGNTRRVILADTLKDNYSYDEIEVILAHEFAHYRLKHLLKMILVNSLVIILSFYLIFKTSGFVLYAFGLASLLDIAALPIIMLYLVICGIIIQPLQNYISRTLEKNADIMALQVTGQKDSFVSMMEKLSAQNLADRNPHPVIKFFFFDHPPIDERIALLKSG